MHGETDSAVTPGYTIGNTVTNTGGGHLFEHTNRQTDGQKVIWSETPITPFKIVFMANYGDTMIKQM
jgi:hypothetical protein